MHPSNIVEVVTGEVYFTAFKALPRPEQEYVLASIAHDQRLRRLLEESSDRAVIAEEREKPSRPLRDYIAACEAQAGGTRAKRNCARWAST